MNREDGYFWLFGPLLGLMAVSLLLPGVAYLPLALGVCALLFWKSGIIRRDLHGMNPIRSYLAVIAPFWVLFTVWGVLLAVLEQESYFFGAIAPLMLPVTVVIWPAFKKEAERGSQATALSPVIYGLAVAAFAGGATTFVVNA